MGHADATATLPRDGARRKSGQWRQSSTSVRADQCSELPQNWQLCTTISDQYSPRGHTIHFEPRVPQLTSTVHQHEFILLVTFSNHSGRWRRLGVDPLHFYRQRLCFASTCSLTLDDSCFAFKPSSILFYCCLSASSIWPQFTDRR